jgi:hypothetical protein
MIRKMLPPGQTPPNRAFSSLTIARAVPPDLRIYWPRRSALDGTWKPPPIELVG